MPEIKKIRDFIVPLDEYPVVYESYDIKIAIKALALYLARGKAHRSILVFKKARTNNGYEDELVGILTLRDILNVIKKDSGSFGLDEMIKIARSISTYDLKNYYYKDKTEQKIKDTTVGDVLKSRGKVFVQAEQSVYEVIDLMLNNNLDIVPVFDGKAPVGVIRALDILDYIRLKYINLTHNQSPAARFAEFAPAKGKLTPL
ncbi:MAG: CBS domain-containing protein [Bacillota bacterium]